MHKRFFASLRLRARHLTGAILLLSPALVVAAELTAMETRWLQAAAPVLAHAKTLNLPIDIVVQPQAGPNDVPMAMGFDGKRCKLVLTMRGNTDAEAILASVAPERRALMIEAMAAHEVGHCWRYAHGVWHALPAGFVDTDPEGDGSPAAARALREMRREEGFSDLVALAWTARRHPEHYQAVLAWLTAVRSEQPVAGGGHDTLVWVRLAGDPAAFRREGIAFEAVDALWTAGLLAAN
jgi:ADP-ribose pyrophosphatase YjhB (NUDIX family)